jgi:hypothetical protein
MTSRGIRIAPPALDLTCFTSASPYVTTRATMRNPMADENRSTRETKLPIFTTCRLAAPMAK